MRATKKCPKCGSGEIYTNEGLVKRGERGMIPISSWNSYYVSAYVCLGCGYFEEYVDIVDLTNVKKMGKLKAEWEKVE